MLKTMPGSPNGISVKKYVENEIYDMPESLANVFINDMKVAVPITDNAPEVEDKALNAAPENASMEPIRKSGRPKRFRGR